MGISGAGFLALGLTAIVAAACIFAAIFVPLNTSARHRSSKPQVPFIMADVARVLMVVFIPALSLTLPYLVK